MFGFVTLIGRNGERIDPELLARIEREGPAYLPFEFDRILRWQNRSGSVAVLGWEAFAEIGGIGSHWFARPDGGLTAFAGYCWPVGSGWTAHNVPWAEQLDRWLGDRDPSLAIDELFGQFDLIQLDANGFGAVVTDFMSCGPLFSVELPGCTLLSNRSGMAALAATPEGEHPTRSPLGAGWLVLDSLIVSDETGYLAVEHVPHGTWIRIDPERGATQSTPDRTLYEARSPGDLPQTYDELVPLMADEIRSLVRYLASLPVDPIELRLSGGKDSRLLAAGVIASRVAGPVSDQTDRGARLAPIRRWRQPSRPSSASVGSWTTAATGRPSRIWPWWPRIPSSPKACSRAGTLLRCSIRATI